jgi:hypothetical protein
LANLVFGVVKYSMDRSIPAITCPVCEAVASNRTPPGFDGLIVRCDNCRDFEILGTVVTKLQGLDLNLRKDALMKARGFTQPGARPSITTLCL